MFKVRIPFTSSLKARLLFFFATSIPSHLNLLSGRSHRQVVWSVLEVWSGPYQSIRIDYAFLGFAFLLRGDITPVRF